MNKAECEQRAKELASKILRASADPLEFQYAIGQLAPLYEMISEGEAEIARLEDDLNRQKAKTEYEAERAGNFENDLDAAKAALQTIADIAEGSGTVNSLPHIAKIARGQFSGGTCSGGEGC